MRVCRSTWAVELPLQCSVPEPFCCVCPMDANGHGLPSVASAAAWASLPSQRMTTGSRALGASMEVADWSTLMRQSAGSEYAQHIRSQVPSQGTLGGWFFAWLFASHQDMTRTRVLVFRWLLIHSVLLDRSMQLAWSGFPD